MSSQNKAFGLELQKKKGIKKDDPNIITLNKFYRPA